MVEIMERFGMNRKRALFTKNLSWLLNNTHEAELALALLRKTFPTYNICQDDNGWGLLTKCILGDAMSLAEHLDDRQLFLLFGFLSLSLVQTLSGADEQRKLFERLRKKCKKDTTSLRREVSLISKHLQLVSLPFIQQIVLK